MNYFLSYWEFEDIKDNPFLEEVTLFWNEKNDEERLSKALELSRHDDVYVLTALIEDFIDAFQGSKSRTERLFLLYMGHDSYSEIIYQKALAALKKGGFNSSKFKAVDHIIILENYIQQFIRPSDINVIIDILNSNVPGSFFHYCAYGSLKWFVKSGIETDKEYFLKLFSEAILYKNENKVHTGFDDYEINYSTEYQVLTMSYIASYSINDVIPLLEKSLYSDDIDLLNKLIGLTKISENSNLEVKRFFLNNLSEFVKYLLTQKDLRSVEERYYKYLFEISDCLYNRNKVFDTILNCGNSYHEESTCKRLLKNMIFHAFNLEIEELMELPIELLKSPLIKFSFRCFICERILYEERQIHNHYSNLTPEFSGKFNSYVRDFLNEYKEILDLLSEEEKEQLENLIEIEDDRIDPTEIKNTNVMFRWIHKLKLN